MASSMGSHVDGDDHFVTIEDVDLLGPPFDIPIRILAILCELAVEIGVGKPVLPHTLDAHRHLLQWEGYRGPSGSSCH